MPTDTHPAALPPLLLDSPDAARVLSISERTLWELTARGEIPAVRIGRAKRYTVAALQEYVARLAAQSNGQPDGAGRR